MMHFSIVGEGSDSWPWWQRRSMQISYLDFFRRGALIHENSDSRGRWSHLVSQYLRRDFVMRCSSIDLSRRLDSWLNMIWWYFLGIVLMRFEISQKLPRRSTIVIHHRDIFLISESDICRDFPSGSTRLLIEFSIVRLRAIRDSFLRWIIFLPIHKTSTIDSFLFVVLRVRFSILQRISIDLLRMCQFRQGIIFSPLLVSLHQNELIWL